MEYLVISIALWSVYFVWYLLRLNKLSKEMNAWNLDSAHDPDKVSDHHQSIAQKNLDSFKVTHGATLIISAIVIVVYYLIQMK
ncbi:hypothetical protein L3081_25480 [Colwellia sp. MSW7]|uniref:DUF3899 domain-containing protein n=1 Tax=Colwellia maritima TaxID=2912588 RepID=A0ABS9X7G4_9GAMM|nr:hypothetical protein [Colwellia maritima]MCI2286168.1 hypothetical protein [Colwellia maritima]